MPQKSSMKGVPTTLQSAATTGNGTALAVNNNRNHTIMIQGSAGVATGAVQFEASNDPSFTGTWAALGGAPVTVVANAVLTVAVVGVYEFIRARISTAITGGTVTVDYIGS